MFVAVTEKNCFVTELAQASRNNYKINFVAVAHCWKTDGKIKSGEQGAPYCARITN